MDSENFTPEEATAPRTLRPMFVTSDEIERHGNAESDARRVNDGAPVEHDWVTERVMDSYN